MQQAGAVDVLGAVAAVGVVWMFEAQAAICQLSMCVCRTRMESVKA